MTTWERFKESHKYKTPADTNINPKHVGDSLRVLSAEDRIEIRKKNREAEREAGDCRREDWGEDEFVLPPAAPKPTTGGTVEIDVAVEIADDDELTVVTNPRAIKAKNGKQGKRHLARRGTGDGGKKNTNGVVEDLEASPDTKRKRRTSVDLADAVVDLDEDSPRLKASPAVAARKVRQHMTNVDADATSTTDADAAAAAAEGALASPSGEVAAHARTETAVVSTHTAVVSSHAEAAASADICVTAGVLVLE